ncbi:MAG TPA: hypothetical protein VKB46_13395, partial [Pyrinomonadaceae bacterium]|nr:hypothetical protein [Pyrinomonadaceae bacterium]
MNTKPRYGHNRASGQDPRHLTLRRLAGKIGAMLYVDSLALFLRRRLSPKKSLVALATLLLAVFVCLPARAQNYQREFETPDRAVVSIKNLDGKVSVVASEEQQKKVTLEAKSVGRPVDPTDITAESKGGKVEITVRPRREEDRIDLLVRVPVRSRIEIDSRAGMVDVIGNVESALVHTDTGTIHADVPVEALKFDFTWEASRPRYMSDVELPAVKEKAGGLFRLSGKLGEKDLKKEDRVALDFRTQRGVVLLNVDPAMAPADLRERPLTEAARAIVRSGDSQLVESIRKVSPKMFGDFAKTLPPLEKEPSLVKQAPLGQLVTAVSPQLMRLTASVTDRNGRAIGGMHESDFTVFENGIERHVTKVVQTNEPFNLVLLLDVSGSVEERMDFIRKAARDFLKTASPQDRISIISFRDDIQVISR